MRFSCVKIFLVTQMVLKLLPIDLSGSTEYKKYLQHVPKVDRSWSRVDKTKPIFFWKWLFLKWVYFVHYFDVFKEKVFQKIVVFVFSTLNHDLLIFDTWCKYLLCSLDLGKSIGINYSIIWVTKNILTQEKHIFSVLPKSDVDEVLQKR